MTSEQFSDLADIILTLKDKSSIIKHLESLYRDATDEGYDHGYEKGKNHGYDMCLDDRSDWGKYE